MYMKKVLLIVSIVVATILLHSCTHKYRFVVKNDTDTNWWVAYQLDEESGIFKNEVYIINALSKEERTLNFPDNKVYFELKPNDTAEIGEAYNTSYDSYRDNSQPTDDTTDTPYVNIQNIQITDLKKSYHLNPKNLEDAPVQNTRSVTLISIKKAIQRESS